jgi:hypothetical protein
MSNNTVIYSLLCHIHTFHETHIHTFHETLTRPCCFLLHIIDVVLAALIAILLNLVKYPTQLRFFVDHSHHEMSVLSSSQPFQRVAADIADAITSPPST